ncbi:hypothetical protein [Streptomyces sp. NPDC058045]|uniref:hypothetical protein n=1 Tax=Streptomyces sp. NPDC058045 TaxID=3346311 RepID=UPI0036EF359B
MPTPYGSHGGMAFGAAELRVLRRALALALHPGSARAEDTQACRRLAEAVDEAAHEGARYRAFLLADLARYRAALPGSTSGYLALLKDALEAGYRPGPDDLAALSALRGNTSAAALLQRCGHAPVPRRAEVPRRRLLALPGGRDQGDEGDQDDRDDEERPEHPKRPEPDRPVPTPAEVFPPKRRPVQPEQEPPQERAAG